MATAVSQPHLESLQQLIETKQATIGIIGLGYVGLPLAKAFIDAGFYALGYDVDQHKVDQLNEGESYIGHIPSSWLTTWIAEKQFAATADPAALAEADVILMCVPTPLTDTRDPDLSYVTATTEQIATVLRPGQLVVLESTTYPGTTRDVVLPILEKAGLEVGEQFFLAYSPEREDPGNPTHSTAKIPKVVGGCDPASLAVAEQLYETIVPEVVSVSSCEVAEACKILENTYRAVNIAMVNELKMLYDQMGVDIWEVINAAKSKPFGFSAFYPGPGLGGHCIPVDPFYLSWVARKHGVPTKFIELAGEINSSMPEYVIKRLTDGLNDRGKAVRGSRIALLGMAYKRDVDDPRESPSFVLLDRLLGLGAKVTYSDPHIASLPKMRNHDVPLMTSQDLTAEYLEQQDCVLISTNHTGFDYDLIAKHASLIIDTRNAMETTGVDLDKLVKA